MQVSYRSTHNHRGRLCVASLHWPAYRWIHITSRLAHANGRRCIITYYSTHMKRFTKLNGSERGQPYALKPGVQCVKPCVLGRLIQMKRQDQCNSNRRQNSGTCCLGEEEYILKVQTKFSCWYLSWMYMCGSLQSPFQRRCRYSSWIQTLIRFVINNEGFYGTE
jgi:hypothetical protein